MKDKIKVWLEKSGYPLELYVNKIFKSRRYTTDSSCLYEDIDTDITREIDAVATRETKGSVDYSVCMEVIVECKKSTKPFLILINDSIPRERYNHFFSDKFVSDKTFQPGFTEGKAFLYLCQYAEQLKQKIGGFAECSNAGYSIVQAFVESDTNVYKGLIGLMKAKEHFDKKHIEFNNKYPDESFDYSKFSVPVLVVDGPLLEAQLDDAGELNITEIDWGTVTINKPWVSDSEDSVNIQVVKKECFDGFLNDLEKLHDFISSEEVVLSTL
jgi:hypothetical protein